MADRQHRANCGFEPEVVSTRRSATPARRSAGTRTPRLPSSTTSRCSSTSCNSGLAAESKRSLLLILQARDAAGKDGTVRSIFSGLNPAGVDVTSFKVPAGREAIAGLPVARPRGVPGRR